MKKRKEPLTAVHREAAHRPVYKGWLFGLWRFFKTLRSPRKTPDSNRAVPPLSRQHHPRTDNVHPLSHGPTFPDVTEIPAPTDRVAETTLPEAFEAGLHDHMENGKLDLPLLPDVVLEVINLSTSDDSDPRKLASILHRNQTLAGHVIRVANSPAYTPCMPIVSLQQAVSRLDMTQPSEIAYTVSVHSRIFKVATPLCIEAAIVTCLADCLSHSLMDPKAYGEEMIRQHPTVDHQRCSPSNLETLLNKREQMTQLIKTMAF